MNNEEIQALMSQLQGAGLKPEDIADGVLWPLFRDGKMSKEDLTALCGSIGLELDPDFDKDPGPAEGEGAVEGVTKEEAEAAKEIKPGESKEEFKEKVEAAVEGEGKPEDKPAPEVPENKPEEKVEAKPEEKSEEDEEWAEAKKLFKL